MSYFPVAKKSLGQHWLNHQDSLQAIAEAADIKAGDTVLEIGPGTGTLTDVLLNKGARVVALEYDDDCYALLTKKYAKVANISLIYGDIRVFDFGKLSSKYKIVANIPYYLTANLLRRLVDIDNKPKQVSILVQKEVAWRVCAKPKKLTPIAIFVQIFYEVGLGQEVAAKLFIPPPKVDSQILKLQLRQKPLIDIDGAFYLVVKAGFKEPRKKLSTSLASGLIISKEHAKMVIDKCGIDGNLRPQAISIQQWGTLVYNLKKLDLLSKTNASL